MAVDVGKTVSQTAGGTLYLILIQVASRALTFIGNQFLLRFLSPTLLGIAVQLELFSVSVLYFSRESLRVALQRQPEQTTGKAKDGKQATESKAVQSQTIVNVSYLVIALGSALTLGFGYVWFYQADVEVLQSPYFTTSLLLYGAATFVELLSEPSFVIIQQNLLYKSRARAETWAAIVKCVAACLTAVLGQRLDWKPSVLPFAVGQCGYAIALLGLYLNSVSIPAAAGARKYSMLPKRITTSATHHHLSYFSQPLLSVASTLYLQSIFKQLLTQGDAFILSFLTTLADQGAFALASNYGGLLARLVFQPIEESSRNAFGKLLSPPTPTPTTTTTPTKPKAAPPSTSPSKPNLTAAHTHLLTILHLYALLSLLTLTTLPTLLPALVTHLINPAFSTPHLRALLATSAYAIPFLAYNGILDAFVTAAATPAELRARTRWVAIIFAVYVASAYVLLRVLGLGAQGLVLGSTLSMALRIWRGWGFVRRYFGRYGMGVEVRDVLPRGITVACCVATAAVLRAWPAEETFWGYGGFVALVPVVGVCGMGGLCVLFFERHFLMQYLSAVLPERHASKIRAYIS